jgi:hypothetical protein
MPEIAVRRAISDERLLTYQAKRIDSENLESIACDWEACMDAEQAMKIRAGRRSRKNLHGARAAYSSLLSAMGIFHCGYCGATCKTWNGGKLKKDGTRTDYYGCQKKSGQTCDKSIMIQQIKFDHLITENLINTLSDTEHLRACWKSAQGDADPEKELTALGKKERQEEEKKRRLVTAISEGVLEFADAKKQIADINCNIQDIKNAREEILKRQSEHFDFEAIAITREEFTAMTVSQQRTIIHAAIARIDLYNSYAAVTYRFPRTTTGDRISRLKLPPQEKPKK